MICPSCKADNIAGVDVCKSCGSDLTAFDRPESREGFRGRLMSDRVGDLRLSPPDTVPSHTSVAGAISRMRETRTGCVLVVEQGELVGLFNERDVLTRVVRKGLDAAATPVSEVMSTDLLTLSPDDPPAFAVHCMVTRGVRHLPVVREREILGYVSVRNLLAYLRDDVLARK